MSGHTTTKPTSNTTSWTVFTRTEVNSPPAVKYTVTTMPPMTEPTQRSSPLTVLTTKPIAMSCAERRASDPIQSRIAIVARTCRP